MSTAKSKAEIVVVHRFSASAERVFDAWLDAENIGKWLFTTPGGEMVRIEIDARVGGDFIITERRNGEDVEHIGRYLEIDRPRRLVFEMSVAKYWQHTDLVTIEIVALESGCELTLTHTGYPNMPGYVDSISAGWAGILGDLDQLLA